MSSPQGTIVVGVDASPAAQAAVQWAAREAVLRGDRLVLMHVYDALPVAVVPGAMSVPQAVFDASREAAEEVVREAAGWVGDAVPTETEIVQGSPGPALEARAAYADLLVVGGSTHHSAVVRLALGSVAQHCVNHARCPVVVVPSVIRPD